MRLLGDYEYVTDQKSLPLIVADAKKEKFIGVDTENSGGLDIFSDLKLLLFQIEIDGKAYVIDARKVDISPFKEILENPQHIKIIQNAVYDYKILRVLRNIHLEGIYDTKIAECLLDAGISKVGHSLGVLSFRYLDCRMDKDTAKEFIDFPYDGEFTKEQLEYAANDVLVLPGIRRRQQMYLNQLKLNPIAELEFSLAIPTAKMELSGIKLDTHKWKSALTELHKKIFKISNDLRQVLPDPTPPPPKPIRLKKDGTPYANTAKPKPPPVLNLDSWQQLAVACKEVDIDFSKANKLTNAGLTNSRTMKLAAKLYVNEPEKAKIIKDIIKYRELRQTEKTFGENLIDFVRQDGRIHASFNQNGTASGRYSSSEPNLQNIQKKGLEGKILRSCFIPETSHKFVLADYSQIELRIAAELSNDAKMIQILNDPRGDIHRGTASEMYNISYDDVGSDLRTAAKCVVGNTRVFTNHGLIKIDSISDNRIPDTFRNIDGYLVGDNKVVSHYYNGIQDTVYIRNEFGYELEGSKTHKVKVLDTTGEIVWKCLKDVEIGDYLVQKLGTNFFGDSTELPDSKVVERTNYLDVPLPKNLTPELSRWFGYVISEGSIYKHNTKPDTGGVIIGINVNNPMLEDVCSVSINIFGNRAKIRKYGDVLKISIHSGKLIQWLSELGISGGAYDKKIPDIIFRTTRENQINFIRALFAGDGCHSHINYASASCELIKDLQILLANFGVLTKRSMYLGKYVRNCGSRSYCWYINPCGRRSINVWKSIIYDEQFCGYDYSSIPYQESNVKSLLPYIHLRVLDIAKECLRSKNRVRLNNTRINTITDGIDTDEARYLRYINQFDFIKVVAKESRRGELFDLYLVDEPHEYVANSFLTHNTINFGLIYGMSSKTLADRLECTQEEANEHLKKYWETYPTLMGWLDKTGVKAVELGYTKTVGGRIRWFNTLSSKDEDYKKKKNFYERVGKNHPIQGTSADMTKVAIVYLDKVLGDYSSKIVNTVHDELCIETSYQYAVKVANIVRDKMILAGEKFLKKVPTLVDVKIRDCWFKDDGVEDDHNGQQLWLLPLEF